MESEEPWHFSNLAPNALLKQVLSQVELPQMNSLHASGSSSEWEQAQFWNQFLRSSSPTRLVENMKTKAHELGIFDMFDEDDYDSIVAAVTRYQAQPMSDLQHLCDGADAYALSALLLTERLHLEGHWESQVSQGLRESRSSTTRSLWEESAIQLRRRRRGASPEDANIPESQTIAAASELAKLARNTYLFLGMVEADDRRVVETSWGVRRLMCVIDSLKFALQTRKPQGIADLESEKRIQQHIEATNIILQAVERNFRDFNNVNSTSLAELEILIRHQSIIRLQTDLGTCNVMLQNELSILQMSGHTYTPTVGSDHHELLETLTQLRAAMQTRPPASRSQNHPHPRGPSIAQICVTTVDDNDRRIAAPTDHRVRTNDCYFIGLLAFLVVTASATIGLYFSIAKDQTGDGFTVASYILAAGTLILGPWVATHYQKCNCRRCWSSNSGLFASDGLEIPLVPFTRSPTLDML